MLRATLAGLLLLLAPLALAAADQDAARNRRDFTVVARDHRFIPDRLEVAQNDLVRLSITAEDLSYSFAIDAFRIVKRIPAGATTTFEFRADQAGTFQFYCALTADDACRTMTGTLVVKAR
jgi:heme/copper-type cytochrome/quinol oxidase subunit 2